MPGTAASPGTDEPGILYYDPNPTTAKLATAGLQLGGYTVFHGESHEQTVELCKVHGPQGDGRIAAILLDACAEPALAATLLRALIQLPGAAQLPGILLVGKTNPHPIAGAEGLPALKRPFSTPALVKIVRETLEDPRPLEADTQGGAAAPRRIGVLLRQFFPELELDPTTIAEFAAEMTREGDTSLVGEALRGDLGAMRLESVLELLGNDRATGILQVNHEDGEGRVHIYEGCVRLAEIRGANEDLKLGRFVVEGGFMRDEELEAFVVGRDPEGRPLGMRLVEGGFLTGPDLALVLLNQAREVTCHLLTWRRGTFSFTATSDLHPLAATATPNRTELLIAEVLLDGLRRLDETAMMGRNMPDLEEVYLRVEEQIARVGRHALTREELSVLELLNGRHGVKDIARKIRTGTFSVATILYRLNKANLARRRVTPVTV